VEILKCTTTDIQNETVQLGHRTCPEEKGGVEVFLCQPRQIFRIIKTSVFLSHSPKTSKILTSCLHVGFYLFSINSLSIPTYIIYILLIYFYGLF